MKYPLAAVPVVAEGVEVEPSANQRGVVLRRPVARGRISAWLEARFSVARERAFELDAHGAAFWAAIDGHRSLSEIQSLLRERHCFGDDEARAAVLAFTQTLMRRGLLHLRVPLREEAPDGP